MGLKDRLNKIKRNAVPTDRVDEDRAGRPRRDRTGHFRLTMDAAVRQLVCQPVGKGDFRRDGAAADAVLAAARGGDDRVEAALVRAAVDLSQGQPAAAAAVASTLLTRSSLEADHELLSASIALAARHDRFNRVPGDGGIQATEISVHILSDGDLRPLEKRWQHAYQCATDPAVRRNAWLAGWFLGSVRDAQSFLEQSCYTVSAAERSMLVANALAPVEELHKLVDAEPEAGMAAYADWLAADLHRRAGNHDAAVTMLETARAAYHAAGDPAGEALCVMTGADWMCAPFSSPVVWNLSVTDSAEAESALPRSLEAQEAVGGQAVSYDEAARLFSAAGAQRGLAAIELRRGYLATLAEQWTKAADHAARAEAMFTELGDSRSANLAMTHLLMCRLSGADVAGLDPLACARQVGSWGAESGSFSYALGLGILINRLSRHWLVRRGRYERALACSRAARELFGSLGARINAAQTGVDQGLIHQLVGERATATTYLERACDEYTALMDGHSEIADGLRNRVILVLIRMYLLAQQHANGDGMERAVARLRPLISSGPTESLDLRRMAGQTVGHSTVLVPLYRSRALRRQGRDDEARRLLRQADDALAALPAEERLYLPAIVLAEHQEYEQAAEAMKHYLFQGGANAGFAGEVAESMAATGGEHGAAEAALQQRRTHEQAFMAFVNVRAYGAAWEHLQALERLGGSQWWDNDGRPWEYLSAAGEVYEARQQAQRAVECHERAVELFEERRAFLSRDELKVAQASDKGAQYLYFLAARANVRCGRIARAFAYAEQGKGRALLDLMAATQAAGSESEGNDLRAWREANMRVVLQRALLAKAREAEDDAGRIETLEAQTADADAKLQEAERLLEQTNPRFFEAIRTNAAPMEADEVCRALPAGTVLIEYFFVGEDLLAWAMTRDGEPLAHHRQVTAWKLALQITRFHQACEQHGDWESVGNELAATLLGPFAEVIRKSERVIFVPHGAAHALPFHALPFDGDPLAATRAVSYLPSASVLQWRRRRDDPALPERILVVGNPTKDLPAARAEAEFVARQFSSGATLLLEDEASAEVVRARLGQSPLLHFATHGVLDAQAPLNSSIKLANGDQLTVYELMSLHLDARLVVLSACRTAQGETTGGDDVLGLTRGLLAAGAGSALVSLWPVDDESTALFMAEFYRQLRAGQSPPEALQDAQNYLRHYSADGAARTSKGRDLFPVDAESAAAVGYDHPYYWAPFVLVG